MAQDRKKTDEAGTSKTAVEKRAEKHNRAVEEKIASEVRNLARRLRTSVGYDREQHGGFDRFLD